MFEKQPYLTVITLFCFQCIFTLYVYVALIIAIFSKKATFKVCSKYTTLDSNLVRFMTSSTLVAYRRP